MSEPETQPTGCPTWKDCLSLPDLAQRPAGDSVLTFVGRYCALAPRLSATKTSLYGAYADYCREVGVRPLARSWFFLHLHRLVPGLRYLRPFIKGRRQLVLIGVSTLTVHRAQSA